MSDLRATADLLNLVFGFDPPICNDHLSWYYRDNPEGTASVGRVDDGNRQLGNYSLVPLRFHARTGPDVRLGLGVDLATHPAARGTGAFRRTVEDSYRMGTADGLDGILGVANTQSAPRMAETMGWRLLPDLRARFLVPVGRLGAASHHPADAGFLAGPIPDEVLPGPTPPPESGYGTRWTADLLRWRLARPGAHYVVHVRGDVALVSTVAQQGPLRVAVLLKVLPRTAGARATTGAAAATLARHHRTPFVLHWGISPHLVGSGVALPRRLMPSPLSLVVHAFDDAGVARFDEATLAVTSFEFLDFNAY